MNNTQNTKTALKQSIVNQIIDILSKNNLSIIEAKDILDDTLQEINNKKVVSNRMVYHGSITTNKVSNQDNFVYLNNNNNYEEGLSQLKNDKDFSSYLGNITLHHISK